MRRKSLSLLVLLFLLFFSSLLSFSFAAESEEPRVASEAAVLIDQTTGEVLYGKNEKRSMYPASITKIVTGIMAIEMGDLNDEITISENARNTEGTRVFLVEGEKVPLMKLVQGLLINSGNDAAVAIAEHFSGSEEAFAQEMNHFIREKIGVTDTHFVNPHGLHHPDHVTTAYDMAMITRYAMRNEVFRSVVSTKELAWKGEGWETTLYNHNKMLWRYEGTTGVKNGYTSEAGYTLVTSAEREGMQLICVVMKAGSAEQAYQDTTKLFDYGFAHYQTNRITKDELKILTLLQPYSLPEEVAFTSRKGEEVAVEVTEAGELRVLGADGRLLVHQQLAPLPAQPEEVQSKDLPFQRIIGWVSWVLLGINGVLLIYVRYLLHKRYRARKRYWF